MDRRPILERLNDSAYVQNWHDQIGYEVKTQIVALEKQNSEMAELLKQFATTNCDIPNCQAKDCVTAREITALLTRIKENNDE